MKTLKRKYRLYFLSLFPFFFRIWKELKYRLSMRNLIEYLKKGDLESFKKAREKYGLTFQEFSSLKQNYKILKKIWDKEIEKQRFNFDFLKEEEIESLKTVGLKTILKRIKKAKKYLKEGNCEKVFIELVKLEKGIEEKLTKKEEVKEDIKGKEVQRLVSWYITLWKNEGKLPPEGYVISDEGKLRAYLYKQFERLLKVLNEEEIKTLYAFWFELDPDKLPKEIKNNFAYKPLFIAKSGRDLKTFIKKINLIRALKEDINNKTNKIYFDFSEYENL